MDWTLFRINILAKLDDAEDCDQRSAVIQSYAGILSNEEVIDLEALEFLLLPLESYDA